MIELKLVELIKDLYPNREFISLHEPSLNRKDIDIVTDVIKSTYVSSVGKHVAGFENDISNYIHSKRAVVTSNGTSALHVALHAAGVSQNDYVLTQALTFIATVNAIDYCKGAEPIFIDVNKQTLGLCPLALEEWLDRNADHNEKGECIYTKNKRVIRACLPMHTFGHPILIDEVSDICKRWNIIFIEDAAESLGSFYKGKHVGTFGLCGIFSFNGNKIITTGGGGAVVSNNLDYINRVKYLSTTAKEDHQYYFIHNEIGFNYRMPNLNAALGVSQLKKINELLLKKRKVAMTYKDFFQMEDVEFFEEPEHCSSNYWLNTIICKDLAQRNSILEITNNNKINTRPAWTPINELPMYSNAIKGCLEQTEWLFNRIINLPSSAI